MGGGSRRAAIAAGVAVALIAALVPLVLVVSAFRLLASESFVRYELGRVGFPSDPYGLGAADRLQLALTGLEAIRPGSEGIALLERATLPGGARAFNERELRHMADVRKLFGRALWAQIAALILLGILVAALLRSPARRRLVPRALLIGSLTMLAVAALAVPAVLIGFDGVFVRFHAVFFAGDSWRFADSDTLLRLYPELFWRHTAQLAAGIVVAQAIAVALAAWWWLRRSRTKAPTVA